MFTVLVGRPREKLSLCRVPDIVATVEDGSSTHVVPSIVAQHDIIYVTNCGIYTVFVGWNKRRGSHVDVIHNSISDLAHAWLPTTRNAYRTVAFMHIDHMVDIPLESMGFLEKHLTGDALAQMLVAKSRKPGEQRQTITI